MDEERWGENEALVRDAVARYPNSAELSIRAAVAQIESRPDRARELAHRAVSLEPKNPALLTRCASFFTATRDFQDAERYAKAAYDLAPPAFEFVAELAYVFGRVAWERGEDDRAERLLELAFRTEPEGFRYGAWLARFYASNERFEDALVILDQTLEHCPGDQGVIGLRREIMALAKTSE